MRKGACRVPKRSSRFRTQKTKKRHSTPTPSFNGKESPREGEVARGNRRVGREVETRTRECCLESQPGRGRVSAPPACSCPQTRAAGTNLATPGAARDRPQDASLLPPGRALAALPRSPAGSPGAARQLSERDGGVRLLPPAAAARQGPLPGAPAYGAAPALPGRPALAPRGSGPPPRPSPTPPRPCCSACPRWPSRSSGPGFLKSPLPGNNLFFTEQIKNATRSYPDHRALGGLGAPLLTVGSTTQQRKGCAVAWSLVTTAR